MQLSKFVVFIFLCVFLISVTFSAEPSGANLVKGKNLVSFNTSEFFYVKTFVNMNPDIEVVSFSDGENTIGYVNFLGGIGENFIMGGGMDYEIIMKENATINLPY